jgi:DNA repair protein RadC
MFRRYLGDALDREHFVVALLDTKNKLIGINTVGSVLKVEMATLDKQSKGRAIDK